MRTAIGIIAGFALLTAACGSDGDPNATASLDSVATTDRAAPIDTSTGTASADSTVPAEVPQRIVSLSPTGTEMLFAIGAGDQLVAVDEFSNYPSQALDLPNELSGFEPNVEAIAAYEPDLVIIGGDFTGLGDQLDALGIVWWDGPAALTLDDTYSQIEQLGAATGHVGDAAELVASMQADIDKIVATAPVAERPLSYYHELDPTLYSADSSTFIGEIYSLLGLVNIADSVEGENGGFPQLSAEFVVSADPDLIFLADTKCCAETAATVGARDGWGALSAVQNGNVFEMDDDIASRWGPRVVEYLAAVAAAVQQASVPS